jgi:KDO2-lipid IV(A) lauroyltransferase
MKKWIRLLTVDLLKALPILLFYGLARLLPVSLSSLLFGKIARFLGPLLSVHKLGLKNLALAFPEKDFEARKQILKNVWENLGRIVGEFPHVPSIAKKRVILKGEDVLEKALSANQPVLFMAGHFGNWELPHYLIVGRGKEIALISRPPNNPWVKKLFDLVRSHPLVPIFFKSRDGSRQIMQHLKSNGRLGVLFDQRLSDGTPLPFFNHQALTALGPAKLAKKYNALMIPVEVQRLGNKVQFQVTFHPPLNTDGSAEDIMTTFNQHLEQWIRKNPHQWLWLHKRWKG